MKLLPTCLACLLCLALQSSVPSGQTTDPIERFKSLASQLSAEPPDSCGSESPRLPSDEAESLESKLLDSVDSALLQALNCDPPVSAAAVRSRLVEMEAASEKIFAGWPRERRFHCELLDLRDLLVVKLTIRSRATFSAYGVPEIKAEPGRKPNRAWKLVGTDSHRAGPRRGDERIDLHPLHMATSGKARFLSVFEQISCGDGQTALEYQGFEWDPVWTGRLKQLLNREGVYSWDLSVEERSSPSGDTQRVKIRSMEDLGNIDTAGSVIKLPYCWHSPVDTWVMATLCGIDTYDLSGDQVQALGTETNRTDLELVARAIQLAHERDEKLLSSLSASPEVARRMAQFIPSGYSFSSGHVIVTHLGQSQETVEMADVDHQMKFVLDSRKDRWIITDFILEDD